MDGHLPRTRTQPTALATAAATVRFLHCLFFPKKMKHRPLPYPPRLVTPRPANAGRRPVARRLCRRGEGGSQRDEGGSGHGAARAQPLHLGAPRESSPLPLQGE
jgi:hypothetical protein